MRNVTCVVSMAAPLLFLPLIAGGCDGSNTSTGGGGAGGSTGGSTGGTVECDAQIPEPPSSDWCERLPGGAPPTQSTLLSWSALHAQVRFFGPVSEYRAADQALATALALDGAWDGADPSAYTTALPGVVCPGATSAEQPTLGPAEVKMVGTVAIVVPGTGEVNYPSETQAVLVDLRNLPWVPGLREAIAAAVAPALSTPVPGLAAKVRKHNGMVDEMFSAQNVYTMSVEQIALPEWSASGATDLPIAMLTSAVMTPDAVEAAVTFRMAKRAWLVGEDLRVELAESRWQGLGTSGVAYRFRDLVLEDGTRLPDALPADERSAVPECFAETILQKGAPGDVPLGEAARPSIKKLLPFDDQEPKITPLGDARAALIVAHGAARLFYPYFETVGDTIDDRLVETTQDLPSTPMASDRIRSLRRLGNALVDGHNFVRDPESGVTGFFGVMIEDINGAPVVRRSVAAGVSPGDTITSIAGVAASEFMATEMALSGGATPGYQFDIAARQMLYLKGPTEFGLTDTNGVEKTLVVDPLPFADVENVWVATDRPAGFLSDLGASDLYYINMDATVLTTNSAFGAALTEAAGAKGLVIDMRGYPGIDHYTAARRLIQKNFGSPVFRVPVLTGPDERTVDESQLSLTPLSNPSFVEPIVLLVGHHTVSAAENFSTMLVDAERVTVIGRQSAGTNGNITGVQLPGLYAFSFTGMEVLHSDAQKSVFHGVGIVPDVEVELSPLDFAAGDDPELNAAIVYLQSL
ncbi:MAG: peptidase S41 [Polyangiaceae bacterium]|nr:peptidase S41 [Polyangiaceae bacterium]